jgi:hypothetical protein
MTVLRHLCGYDKKMEPIAVEHLLPEVLLPKVRTVIKPKRGDRSLALAFDITLANTRKLADMLGVAVDAYAYDFTVESGYIPQAAQLRASVA